MTHATLLQALTMGDPTAVCVAASLASTWLSGILLLSVDPSIEGWRGIAGVLMGLGAPVAILLTAVTELFAG